MLSTNIVLRNALPYEKFLFLTLEGFLYLTDRRYEISKCLNICKSPFNPYIAQLLKYGHKIHSLVMIQS